MYYENKYNKYKLKYLNYKKLQLFGGGLENPLLELILNQLSKDFKTHSDVFDKKDMNDKFLELIKILLDSSISSLISEMSELRPLLFSSKSPLSHLPDNLVGTLATNLVDIGEYIPIILKYLNENIEYDNYKEHDEVVYDYIIKKYDTIRLNEIREKLDEYMKSYNIIDKKSLLTLLKKLYSIIDFKMLGEQLLLIIISNDNTNDDSEIMVRDRARKMCDLVIMLLFGYLVDPNEKNKEEKHKFGKKILEFLYAQLSYKLVEDENYYLRTLRELLREKRNNIDNTDFIKETLNKQLEKTP